MIDIAKIAVAIIIAQMVRPFILATAWVIRDSWGGEYYRLPEHSFIVDLICRAMLYY